MIRSFEVYILLFACNCAFAGGGGYRPLDTVISEASDIVIARIVDAGSSGAECTKSLQLETIVKGGAFQSGAVVSATGRVSNGQSCSADHNRGIFFLSGSGGARRLVPLVSGTTDERSLYIGLPLLGTGTLQGDGVKEQVILEVLRVMERGESLPFAPAIDWAFEYRSSPNPAVTQVWRRWLSNGPPSLVQFGLRTLLAVNDVQALKRVATESSFTTDEAANKAFGTDAANAIFRAVDQFRSSDPEAVATLGSLAVNKQLSTRLRVAAARALANIHSRESLPYLATLLDEEELGLITSGVGGLSAFANNLSIGGHEPRGGKYQTSETIAHSAFDERVIAERGAYYVIFWRDWWRQNQKDLLQ